jgi:hypothetical protein
VATNQKPLLFDGYFKRGSAWLLSLARKQSDGTRVDLTGMTARAMFRVGDEDGAVTVTLSDSGGGIAIDAAARSVAMTLLPEQTVLFAPGAKVLFDVELTPMDGLIWQSPTYWFRVVQEVTRDD